MAGYATVADYELRTGTDVPVEMEPTVQQRLDDTSALINVYLGDCVGDVAAKYPEVLTALTVSHVHRVASIPTGVRSESVGSTSVSYNTDTGPLDLIAAEMSLLDALIDGACGGDAARGIGQVGVGYGGPTEVPADTFGWPENFDEIDTWVLSGGRRRR